MASVEPTIPPGGRGLAVFRRGTANRPQGTAYHRLAREAPFYRWWRLPLATVIAVAGYAVVSIGAVMAVGLVVLAAGGDANRLFDQLSDGNLMASPGVFALSMLSIIAMIPAVVAGVVVAYTSHTRYLISVAGRIRWAWLARSAVIALAFFAVTLGGLLWLSPDPKADPRLDGTALALTAITVLLVPFQAAAEELVFRGLLFQLFGSWLRWPLVALVMPTIAFVSGHDYNHWGLLDVGCFGVGAAVLAVRTGGLEAPVAVHAANNLVLMLFSAFGLVSDSAQAGSGDPAGAALTAVTMLTLVAVFEWQARRTGLATRRPAIPVPEPAPRRLPPPGQLPYLDWNRSDLPVVNPPVGPLGAVPPNAPDYPGQVTWGWER